MVFNARQRSTRSRTDMDSYSRLTAHNSPTTAPRAEFVKSSCLRNVPRPRQSTFPNTSAFSRCVGQARSGRCETQRHNLPPDPCRPPVSGRFAPSGSDRRARLERHRHRWADRRPRGRRCVTASPPSTQRFAHAGAVAALRRRGMGAAAVRLERHTATLNPRPGLLGGAPHEPPGIGCWNASPPRFPPFGSVRLHHLPATMGATKGDLVYFPSCTASSRNGSRSSMWLGTSARRRGCSDLSRTRLLGT